MVLVMREPHLPDAATVQLAAEAADALVGYLRAGRESRSGRIALHIEDEAVSVEVPAEALRLLVEILDQLANGNAVTVAPVTAELTTQQAADLLNVSRPYLIGLLEQRAMPFRYVGNRRKIRLTDVLAYRRTDDEHRQAALDELTRDAESMGAYRSDG